MRQSLRTLILVGQILAGLLCGAGAAYARDRALVVGINQYPLINNGDNNLAGAVADARSFAAALETIFRFEHDDIKLLLDGEATRTAIVDGFEHWLIAGSEPGDRVVFFFAGHGATAMIREKGGERPTSTLVAADATLADGIISNMIEGRQIGKYVERLKDRRVTVFADSCHSGSVTRGLGDPPTGVRTLTPRVPVGLAQEDLTRQLQSEMKTATALIDRSLVVEPRSGSLSVWSAATVDQFTYDLPDRSGGIFTQSFLRGLHELGLDKDLNAAEPGKLYAYVRDQAAAFCRQRGPGVCSGLTPGLEPTPAAYRDLTLAPDPPRTKPDTAAQAVSDAVGLLAHHNDFPLDVAVLPSAHVRLHDQIRFRITSGEAGTLVILDAGPDGTLRQIYPNKYGRANRSGQVRAGAPTTIPDADYGFSFEATDVGSGRLLVLVADPSLDLSSIIGQHLNGKPAADPRGIVVELAEFVQAPIVTPNLDVPNGSHRWAFKAVSYRIDP